MKPHRCEISIGVLTFPPGCPQAAWQRENNTQVFKQQNHWHGHFFFFHGPCPLPTTCNDSLFSNQSYFFIYYSWGHSTEAKISSSVKSWHIHADLSAFFLSFSHTHTHGYECMRVHKRARSDTQNRRGEISLLAAKRLHRLLAERKHSKQVSFA